MEYRVFNLNKELSIIHYPEKPNGFGILILGNEEQFVDDNGSSWLRNNSRKKILTKLMETGYTIFYSNLGGKHMGNEQACEQAKDLYEYIKRTEILNDKIHIIAEGIGASTVQSFIEDKGENIRSILFINPIFSLYWMYNMLKDQPFLYKKFLADVSQAHGIPDEQADEFIQRAKNESFSSPCPFKIIHILEHGIRDSEWIKLYKNFVNLNLGRIHLILPEKRSDISNYAFRLFKLAEHPL
ncbi:hydrolase [Caldibacillus lycopersici]|uniref:Hydrolase n=1 Tax=Perspicuibacillus lycopersici TaxID=1325689 RepID=A0AAE3LM92_9BACI|nr:hydrolase [Perspicuibacillus lycopersici]MCU9612447.1 hydrolase [Perspicuibacillus lycopersici]